MEGRKGATILSARIDALTWTGAVDEIERWTLDRQSRYVCICNVHSVVTAAQDPGFRDIVNGADMATPDGMPVAWALRWLGFADQQRINGPDLTLKLCARMSEVAVPVYFFGSSEHTLSLLGQKLRAMFPGLRVAGMVSPPFRALTPAEDNAAVAAINSSGAGIVFVSLGCPKQEQWMAEHRGRVHAVMIGVGAAFDYHAGTLKRAPAWMQDGGLEWFYRFVMEPRRLWKRYLVTNALFVALLAKQLLFRSKEGRGPRSLTRR